MKPILGIVCSYYGSYTKGNEREFNFKEESYLKKIKDSGSIPLMIPVRPSLIEDIPQIIKKMDGIILSGGVDVHPSFYNEEPMKGLGHVDYVRDEFEIELARYCIEKMIPILGICRGMQVLNVATGGTLYQDINTQLESSIQHTQKTSDRVGNHHIEIKENTFLYKVYGKRGFVNSYHHQAVKDLSEDFEAIAWSEDGLIESMIHKNNQNVIALQWHPELLDVKESESIFKFFTNLMK